MGRHLWFSSPVSDACSWCAPNRWYPSPLFSSPPRKRGSGRQARGWPALGARFRGHDKISCGKLRGFQSGHGALFYLQSTNSEEPPFAIHGAADTIINSPLAGDRGDQLAALTPRLRTASLKREVQMGIKGTLVLYVSLMVTIIVAVDFLFFRNRLWERLMANIGIVLVFAAFYLSFLKRP